MSCIFLLVLGFDWAGLGSEGYIRNTHCIVLFFGSTIPSGSVVEREASSRIVLVPLDVAKLVVVYSFPAQQLDILLQARPAYASLLPSGQSHLAGEEGHDGSGAQTGDTEEADDLYHHHPWRL